jgi:hypothetical protein
MALFEVRGRRLDERRPVSFSELGLREREDLQVLLIDQIAALGPDLKVIAQEFGQWEDARRRLDILAVDRERHLVVIELKRTEDGGHAELQALRYAAMIATLTFEEVAAAYSATLRTRPTAGGPTDVADPRTDLVEFLGFEADEEPALSDDVRIILGAADFGRELTTAVLWLNRFDGMDIRCVRLRPYQVGEHVLIDVEQVIPLPEAADYQVRLRRKEVERARANTDRRDFTRYVVSVSGKAVGEFNKRHTLRTIVDLLLETGIPPERLAAALPDWALRRLDGNPTADQMADAVAAATGTLPQRYFLDHPIRVGDQTWVLSRAWGANLESRLDALLAAFPDSGITYTPAARLDALSPDTPQ